ncbi:MAG: hypothetical protein H3C62_10790 [Gemmatimonadaceae bacterium]|nr:hypothetical protein [Gemmatimonadaceae bacterium]
MLLIWTNRRDATADFFEARLQEHRVPYARWNTDLPVPCATAIAGRRATSQLRGLPAHDPLDLQTVHAIWYRRPEVPAAPPDLSPQAAAFVAAEYTAYFDFLHHHLGDARWVSHPTCLRAARSKPAQLGVASAAGLRTPRTRITNQVDVAAQFLDECEGQVIGKVLSLGAVTYGEDIAQICTTAVTPEHLRDARSTFHLCPTYLQERIAKAYEVRVTVFGTEVFAAMIDSQADPARRVDWRRPSANAPRWAPHTLPEPIAAACRTFLQHYGLRFGAFDFAVTPSGEYVFFECNPNGQWAWLEEALALPLSESLIRLLS